MAWREHGRGPAGCGSPGALTARTTGTAAAVATVFREEAGRLTGALVRLIGDFDLAEEVVQDSLVAALEKWPEQGIPAKPGAWLMTTAKRRAIDILRRDQRYAEKVRLLERSTLPAEPAEADDRLRLIFTCCHPALSAEAQVALTLRAVVGFTTTEIAAAFLVSEVTMAQRIVRAKRKIVAANIPYRVPQGEELAARLEAVLAVLYLMFNEGHLSRGASVAMRRDLAEDALWLTRLVATLMPDQAEVLGLLALMQLSLARAGARFDAAGDLVLLPDQDRRLWDQAAIADGIAVLDRAGSMHSPGPYQLQAAIAALHSEAATWEQTDWRQIILLYDALLRTSDGPVIRLNRAIALSQIAGPEVALGEVNDLAIALSEYHLFHSARAELLDQLGEPALARAARCRALELCSNPAERSLLARKLGGQAQR
ncbi:sigma-70 family RNA polymerase sigma factor [bacterium]|nr:MAG: sigma-70 family RNA polymerase sigma factor [bacterium]